MSSFTRRYDTDNVFGSAIVMFTKQTQYWQHYHFPLAARCLNTLTTCMELQVLGPPLMRCLRSGGRMLSRIRFSWSLATRLGPWLLTTLLAEKRRKVKKHCYASKDTSQRYKSLTLKDFTFDLRLNEYIGNLYRDETQDIFRRRKILTYQPLRNPKILTRKYVVIFKSKFISQVVICFQQDIPLCLQDN